MNAYRRVFVLSCVYGTYEQKAKECLRNFLTKNDQLSLHWLSLHLYGCD